MQQFERQANREAGKAQRRSWFWQVAFALSIACATSSAHAGNSCSATPLPSECETIQITATLDDVNDGQDILAPIAPTITGIFTFDSSVPDSVPGDSQVGEYIDTVACGSFDLGSEILGFVSVDDPDVDPGIFIENDIPDGAGMEQTSSDVYGVVAGGVGGTPSAMGATAFSLTLTDVCVFFLGGCPSSALTNDAIPQTPPNPSNFLVPTLRIQLSVLNAVAFVDAIPTSLTSVTPIPCPEPSARLLTATALVTLWGVAGRAASRHRQA